MAGRFQAIVIESREDGQYPTFSGLRRYDDSLESKKGYSFVRFTFFIFSTMLIFIIIDFSFYICR